MKFVCGGYGMKRRKVCRLTQRNIGADLKKKSIELGGLVIYKERLGKKIFRGNRGGRTLRKRLRKGWYIRPEGRKTKVWTSRRVVQNNVDWV